MEDPAAFAELPPRRVAQYGPAIVADVVASMAPTWQPYPDPPSAAAFGIHFGNSIAGRRSAAALINRMYRWRGYGDKHFLEPHAGHLTLNASSAEALLATVTLRVDSAAGLLADDTFGDAIDGYRRAGARVCEVTRLALDPLAHTRLALASLFHILYIHARKSHLCSDAFIEVHPRHRRFYEQMLGFRHVAGKRHNLRVDAPAHLLHLDLELMGAQIARFGGTGAGNQHARRSLYPYFFGPAEEANIAAVLTSMV